MNNLQRRSASASSISNNLNRRSAGNALQRRTTPVANETTYASDDAPETPSYALPSEKKDVEYVQERTQKKGQDDMKYGTYNPVEYTLNSEGEIADIKVYDVQRTNDNPKNKKYAPVLKEHYRLQSDGSYEITDYSRQNRETKRELQNKNKKTKTTKNNVVPNGGKQNYVLEIEGKKYENSNKEWLDNKAQEINKKEEKVVSETAAPIYKNYNNNDLLSPKNYTPDNQYYTPNPIMSVDPKYSSTVQPVASSNVPLRGAEYDYERKQEHKVERIKPTTKVIDNNNVDSNRNLVNINNNRNSVKLRNILVPIEPTMKVLKGVKNAGDTMVKQPLKGFAKVAYVPNWNSRFKEPLIPISSLETDIRTDGDVRAAVAAGVLIPLSQYRVIQYGLAGLGSYGAYDTVKTKGWNLESGTEAAIYAGTSVTPLFGKTLHKVDYKARTKKIYADYLKHLETTKGKNSIEIKQFKQNWKRAFEELPRNVAPKEYSIKEAEALSKFSKKEQREITRIVNRIVREEGISVIGSSTIPPSTTLKTPPRGKAGDIDVQKTSKQFVNKVYEALKAKGYNVAKNKGNFDNKPKEHLILGSKEQISRHNVLKKKKGKTKAEKKELKKLLEEMEFINVGSDTQYFEQKGGLQDVLPVWEPSKMGWVRTPKGVRMSNIRDQMRVKILQGYKKGGRAKDVEDVIGIKKGTDAFFNKKGEFIGKKTSASPFHENVPLKKLQAINESMKKVPSLKTNRKGVLNKSTKNKVKNNKYKRNYKNKEGAYKQGVPIIYRSKNSYETKQGGYDIGKPSKYDFPKKDNYEAKAPIIPSKYFNNEDDNQYPTAIYAPYGISEQINEQIPRYIYPRNNKEEKNKTNKTRFPSGNDLVYGYVPVLRIGKKEIMGSPYISEKEATVEGMKESDELNADDFYVKKVAVDINKIKKAGSQYKPKGQYKKTNKGTIAKNKNNPKITKFETGKKKGGNFKWQSLVKL